MAENCDSTGLRNMQLAEFSMFYSNVLWHAPQRVLTRTWTPGLAWIAGIKELNTPRWFIEQTTAFIHKPGEGIGLKEIFAALYFLSQLPVGQIDPNSPPPFNASQHRFRSFLDVDHHYQSTVLNEALLLMARQALSDMKRWSIRKDHPERFKEKIYNVERSAWLALEFKSTISFMDGTLLLDQMEACRSAMDFPAILACSLQELRVVIRSQEVQARNEVFRAFPVPLPTGEDPLMVRLMEEAAPNLFCGAQSWVHSTTPTSAPTWNNMVLANIAPSTCWENGARGDEDIDEAPFDDLAIDLAFLDASMETVDDFDLQSTSRSDTTLVEDCPPRTGSEATIAEDRDMELAEFSLMKEGQSPTFGVSPQRGRFPISPNSHSDESVTSPPGDRHSQIARTKYLDATKIAHVLHNCLKNPMDELDYEADDEADDEDLESECWEMVI